MSITGEFLNMLMGTAFLDWNETQRGLLCASYFTFIKH